MIDTLAAWIAARGRMALIVGLIVGMAFPSLAQAMRPAIWPLVITLLFLSILRLGTSALRLPRANLVPITALTLALQIAVPLMAFGIFAILGLAQTPWAQALVLILAAAPITGAAPITVMSQGAPDLALRQTVLGTMVLPFTIVPVLVLIPSFGTPADIGKAALILLGAIGCAAFAAMALHRGGIARPTARNVGRIDGLTAVLLAVVVIGLMSGASDTIRTLPMRFVLIMALVSAANFTLQALAGMIWPSQGEKTAVAVVAGNRNAALLLGVLPDGMSTDMLLVIGCYQVPMYLTPFVLPWMRARLPRWRDT